MAVKVVIDSNLLVSALLTRDSTSPSVRLFQSAVAGDIAAHTSPFQLAELVDVLGRPKFRPTVSVEDAMRFVGLVRDRFNVVVGAYRDLDVVPDDAKDSPIVALALEAGAKYLISDDRKHLLRLKVILVRGYKPLQIVSMETFNRLRGTKR